MSNQTADAANVSKSNNNLPQFMNENSKVNYTDIEENTSWLTNNLHRLMIWVSAAWFAVVLIYITQFFGWSNLFLMMPDEFGGFLAGITLPLAIIWVVMAYIDRGTSFKQEAKFLRAYMNQLVYPEQGAPQTAKAMADAIRSQVVELQQVTKLATEQTAKIKDEIGSNINEFAKLVSTLDTYSSKTIVELSDGVKFLVKNFENITSKAETSAETVAQYNREFISGAGDIEKNINALFDKLLPRINEIKSTAGILQEISDSSNHNILRANELLTQFNQESTDNLSRVSETLNNQTSILQKISENAVENCGIIQKTVGSEIDNLGTLLNSHVAQLDSVINEHDYTLRQKLSEMTNHAMEGCKTIGHTIEKELGTLDHAVDLQINKVDTAMGKHRTTIAGQINELSEKTDLITSKLGTHGSALAQEIDKLMVRSNTLEESISIQVENLNNVAETITGSMQKVDTSLAGNITSLHEKSEAAVDDITTYISTLEGKTTRLEELSTAVLEKSARVSDEIVRSHNSLNNVIGDISDRIESLNDEILASSDMLKKQAEQSVNKINSVGDSMNKHAMSLTEASSIVVSQSQISEAALSQQQRNITNSANRVEEIKSELKRQIDELYKASAAIEDDAALTVERLKKQLDIMIASCDDVITKSKSINDNLAEQATQFDTNTNKTLTKVTQLENILVSQSQNMEALSKAVTERAHEVDSILDRQTKALDKATETTNSTMQQLATSFENQNTLLNHVAESTVGYVSDVVQSLDDKAAALGMLFKQQENEFFNICDKIAENTVSMSDALKKQIAIIEQSADKVFSRMVLLEEDTSKHAEAVVANSNRSIDRLSEIEDLISAKNAAVGSLVENVTRDLSSIADKVQEKINVFDNTVRNIREESNNSVKIIQGNCTKIQAANSDLSNETQNITKLMDDHVKTLDVALVKTKLQSDDIKQTLENQKDSLTDVVNTLATQTRLGEASLAQQYKYLSDATTEVAQKVKEINESFKANTDTIFDTSTKVAYEFDVLGDRLIKAGEDVQKTAKSSIKSIEEVNMSLSQCSEDLDATIHHSVENIGGVFKDYEKYLAGFNTVTAETSTGVIEINNLISEQSDKMVQISEDTKKLVDCFNTVLNDTSTALSNRANIAYDKVKGLGENLKNLGMQLEEATKLSAAHFENSGDKLRATINEISANAERISNEIRTSGEVFIKQSGVLVAATEDTLSKVHGVMSELVETGKEFNEKGDNIVKQSIHFNDVVSAQIKLLNEHTKRADATLETLSSTYEGVKIDTFLKDASSIIEKLETISVDINRVFNPKDEEDLWKKYYNGDTSVFVRYLARNMTKAQIQAIRKEFEQNGDFRTLVSGYLSEFEVLVSRAKANERSGVLLSVITGADIGKLYYILAKTLDKLN